MNLKNKILPAIAAVGLLIAIGVAIQAQHTTPPAQPVAQPAQAPFKSYIGGAGLIEASSNNINIGTALPGIVKTVFVKVGDKVRSGARLFQIDDRELLAELRVKESNLLTARAAVQEALATLEDARSQYALVRGADSTGAERAVSVDDVQKRRNAALLAQARVDSAKAAVVASSAELGATQSAIERLSVRAPIDGEIMQVNIRAGEFAQTGVLATPLLMMGNLDLLYVRVNIDENDAWRFQAQTHASASMRGNRELRTDLGFVRVEPYVTPKLSLTGASTERVDTRVLQVLYSFRRNALPAYVGQQMDVFIETPERPQPEDPKVAPQAANAGGAPQ